MLDFTVAQLSGEAPVPSGCMLPRICAKYEPQPNRLFSRREAQGAPSEVVEVGDLPRRENKPDSALVGLFSDHDDGQQGRQGSPQAAVGRARLPTTPAMALGVIGPPADAGASGGRVCAFGGDAVDDVGP
jgi:hypothetical protein